VESEAGSPVPVVSLPARGRPPQAAARSAGPGRIGFWEPGPDGQRKRRWQGGFKTRAEAARALRKVLSQVDDGSYVPPRPDTVGTYLHDWFRY
jgi:hypothetical protein